MPIRHYSVVPNPLKSLREAAGLTQAQLAERANTSQSQIDRLEKGERRLTTDWMVRVAAALGVEPKVLLGDATIPVNAKPLPAPPPRAEMPRDVPVYGTAMGANGDGAFLLNQTAGVVGRVRRGPGIAENQKVFAIYVEGDSMAPRFDPGELVYLDPTRPCRAGDDIVFIVEPDQAGDAPRAFLKRLVRRTADRLICEQFNPAKQVEFPMARVRQPLFRVLRLHEVMGV